MVFVLHAQLDGKLSIKDLVSQSSNHAWKDKEE